MKSKKKKPNKQNKPDRHKQPSHTSRPLTGTLDVTRSGMGFVIVEGRDQDILVVIDDDAEIEFRRRHCPLPYSWCPEPDNQNPCQCRKANGGHLPA